MKKIALVLALLTAAFSGLFYGCGSSDSGGSPVIIPNVLTPIDPANLNSFTGSYDVLGYSKTLPSGVIFSSDNKWQVLHVLGEANAIVSGNNITVEYKYQTTEGVSSSMTPSSENYVNIQKGATQQIPINTTNPSENVITAKDPATGFTLKLKKKSDSVILGLLDSNTPYWANPSLFLAGQLNVLEFIANYKIESVTFTKTSDNTTTTLTNDPSSGNISFIGEMATYISVDMSNPAKVVVGLELPIKMQGDPSLFPAGLTTDGYLYIKRQITINSPYSMSDYNIFFSYLPKIFQALGMTYDVNKPISIDYEPTEASGDVTEADNITVKTFLLFKHNGYTMKLQLTKIAHGDLDFSTLKSKIKFPINDVKYQ